MSLHPLFASITAFRNGSQPMVSSLRTRRSAPRLFVVLALCLCVAPAAAQWNPAAGDWTKTDPTDLRVMTWNVEDGLCSTNPKAAGLTNWEALSRIVASFQPDVLIMQECADNSGNGTGSGADSVADLETTLELFMHGGPDPFNGGAQVAAYVQLYSPSYDLPFIFVSGKTDGFNRDVIMSRYPFSDLNGDGLAEHADFLQLGDLYSPGVNGGIRGYQHAEIDLPDGTYLGDLVIGNNHLKAGGSASDHNQRIAAAQNIAYYIDAMFNGLGGGVADPNSKIISPGATALISPDTLVITGGDWNEDEINNGATKGPADWIVKAALTGGTDGTDRDRSDMTYDASGEFFTGNTSTLSSSKLDYLAWQDSIGTLRHSIVFNSTQVPAGLFPPELAGFFINPQLASGIAADHRPVIADFVLPLVGGCVSVATNLGNGLAGMLGIVPALEACGDLSTGGTADFNLTDALPLSQAYLVFSLNSIFAPFSGGILVPAPDFIIGPFPTDSNGEVQIAAVAGGGGPFDVYVQFVILDPAAILGRSFSNGIQVHWQP